MPEITSDKHWHLDRRVPLGIILAIVVQTLVLAYYVGGIDNRVAQLEQHQTFRADERDRLIAVETQMRGIHETLIRIERSMERERQLLRGQRSDRDERDARQR